MRIRGRRTDTAWAASLPRLLLAVIGVPSERRALALALEGPLERRGTGPQVSAMSPTERVLRVQFDAERPHADVVYCGVRATLACSVGSARLAFSTACRRHWSDSDSPSNTARLAALAMPNLTLLDYGTRGTTWNSAVLNLAKPALLFPDSHEAPTLTYTPLTVVVVDGSWPQARKLVNKLPQLREMPRIHVHPNGDRRVARLRRPPIADGMSTIEAIARAVELLEGPSKAALLDELYSRVVANCASARGRDFDVL